MIRSSTLQTAMNAVFVRITDHSSLASTSSILILPQRALYVDTLKVIPHHAADMLFVHEITAISKEVAFA